jgi:hypothetical protein
MGYHRALLLPVVLCVRVGSIAAQIASVVASTRRCLLCQLESETFV